MQLSINDMAYGVIKRAKTSDHLLLVLETSAMINQVVIEVLAHTIVVNQINYKHHELDAMFIDQALVGSKAIFIVKDIQDEVYTGDLYKIPLANGHSVELKRNTTVSKKKENGDSRVA